MGKVQSHLGAVESSQEKSQHEEVGREEVEEEGKGSQRVVGAYLSAALGVPMEGLLSSASLAWEVQQEVQRNLLMKTQLLMRSWMMCQFERLDQTW